jgi:hypothetical protein
MKTPIIIGLVVVGILLIISIPLAVQRFFKKPLGEAIERRYSADQILLREDKANCFGRQRDGVAQIRGNGVLVLATNELFFVRALPKAEFSVPLETIGKMEITKSHLGKAVPYDLLKVYFEAEEGEDSVAWWVEEPAAWIQRIEALKAGQ